MVVPCFSKEQTSAPLDYGLSKQARECWDNKDIPGATRNLLAFFKPRAAVFRMTGSGAPFWDVVSDSLQEVGEGETSAMFWNENWNEGEIGEWPCGQELGEFYRGVEKDLSDEGYSNPWLPAVIIECRKELRNYGCAYAMGARFKEEYTADDLGLWWGCCDGGNCRTSDAEWEVLKPILEHKRALSAKYNAKISIKYPWAQDPRKFFWYDYRDLALRQGVKEADAVICNDDWNDGERSDKVTGEEFNGLIRGLKDGMSETGFNFYLDESARCPKDASEDECGLWHG